MIIVLHIRPFLKSIKANLILNSHSLFQSSTFWILPDESIKSSTAQQCVLNNGGKPILWSSFVMSNSHKERKKKKKKKKTRMRWVLGKDFLGYITSRVCVCGASASFWQALKSPSYWVQRWWVDWINSERDASEGKMSGGAAEEAGRTVW